MRETAPSEVLAKEVISHLNIKRLAHVQNSFFCYSFIILLQLKRPGFESTFSQACYFIHYYVWERVRTSHYVGFFLGNIKNLRRVLS